MDAAANDTRRMHHERSAEEQFNRSIGTRAVRPDGVDKVTGRANFGADFSLPGMLYGKVLRSPHAHARIKSIDTSRAAAIEGVKAIVTGADFPASRSEPVTRRRRRHRSSRSRSQRHGARQGRCITAMRSPPSRRPVAAIADAALAAIEVDYEVLAPVMDLDAAMADDAT